ncbi:MAG: site-specific integrase [Planctomycetes bacterium]|nr:site-specific integrase [Planctomycetota bacterium]
MRPVAEFGRAKVKLPPDECKGRRTWRRAPLTLDTLDAAAERGRKSLAKRPDKIVEFERLGRERGLIYKTLLLTGLRQGELASLTVGQLELDGPTAYAVLDAADEKNREGSDIPLRADLVNDLRAWLADELSRLQSEARLRIGQPVPLRLPADRPVFNVPSALVRILDRDLVAAGIPKRDERGRTFDVHAMRHTFGTHLSKGGVPLRTAQAAMRHSKPDLTANVYTDPKLLDVAGALDVLPSLPLDADDRDREAERLAATGTEDVTGDALAPMLAPTLGKGSISGTIADKNTDPALPDTHADAANVSDCGRKRKPPLTSPANSGQAKRVKGLEPSTFSLEG